jgi:hypothetical protein
MFVCFFPDGHVGGPALANVAMMHMTGQFSVIRPVHAHWSLFLDVRNKNGQGMLHPRRELEDAFGNPFPDFYRSMHDLRVLFFGTKSSNCSENPGSFPWTPACAGVTSLFSVIPAKDGIQVFFVVSDCRGKDSVP